VCCSVLQSVLVCCFVLLCVVVCCSVHFAMRCVGVCRWVAEKNVCSIAVQYVALCCTVLHGVALCCTVLHCFAVCDTIALCCTQKRMLLG